MLHIGLLAYNLLRVIGQESLRLDGAPLRKHVHRRFKSVKNMIAIAVRVVRHARRFKGESRPDEEEPASLCMKSPGRYGRNHKKMYMFPFVFDRKIDEDM
ncbi:hypothetical protein TR75_09180 [Hydrogenibacillus schlegelii]|uniref:Transposase DDE domain-containing protein n=1 Tax=Hydrogenibacillus schlegelii TaxID=1484 RepID=A0A132MKH2_HYDSH|nr:hypothetical protein TR75_09180 [Hydrogenibacillus schlegelii]OAR03751.1 hypothetical protein SA87_00800 [Hydrogenibacillus schlegelii]PTQ51791.1 MAG: hypothetical protein HSCHL_1164 [Hydrogenibacillus schlegelii]